MAIAFGTAVNGGRGVSPYTSSSSITVNAGDVLVVGIWRGGASTGDTMTGVTWDGGSQAMTQAKKLVNGTEGDIYIYFLQNPTAATSTVSATASESGVNIYILMATYSGVKTSAQPSATSSAAAAATTVTDTITTVDDNSWTVLMGGNVSGTPAAGTGLVRRIQGDFSESALFDSNGAVTPAGGYGQTWTGTTLLGDVSMALSPPGSATASRIMFPSKMSGMGVGGVLGGNRSE